MTLHRTALILICSLCSLPASLSAQDGNPAGQDLKPPPPAVAPEMLHLGRDSVTATPGETYPAGPIQRFFLGDLHRSLWELPFSVPILDLDSVGGGLSVEELSGGKQTLGVHFKGEDGLLYQFRSIVKSSSGVLPDAAEGTFIEAAVQDAMASQFPLSAMVVAELLNAAGVLVARPHPVVMPDDPRLGEYREALAGRMGWIEARPDEREDDRPGWAGSSKITGTDELHEELREEPGSYVDARSLLRARLIDLLVGDRDRHSDQWRWASFEDEDGRLRWEPIPRDRDWALARIDGVLPWLAGFYFPRYVGLEGGRPDVVAMSWSAQHLDRTLLTGMGRSEFVEVAEELQSALGGDVLQRAVGVLPPSYLDAVGGEVLQTLTVRRDAMVEWATEYYELLAGWVDVHGTTGSDSIVVSAAPEGGMRVQAFALDDDAQVVSRFDRVFVPDETDEVRIYLWDGEDHVAIEGPDPLPIDVRIAGAGGDDRYVDHTVGEHVLVYDDQGANTLELGDEAVVTDGELLVQDSIRTAYALWNTRDWGAAIVPRPELRYDSDVGAFVGLGIARYGYGWGYSPYRTKASLSVLNGLGPRQWIVDAELDRPLGHSGLRWVTSVDAFTDKPTWLFGFGNDTPAPASKNTFRSFRSDVSGGMALHYQTDPGWMAFAGARVSRLSAIEAGSPVFDSLAPYGSGRFAQAGFLVGIRADTRDSEDMPTSGFHAELRGSVFPTALDVQETFGTAHAELGGVASADLPGQPALTLRLIGERAWGRTPYHELPALGGSSSLPGFVSQRFVGHTAASASGLLRVAVAQPALLTDLQLGLHGLATAGRVWATGEDSDTLHRGFGGGLWLAIPSLERVVSFTAVSGDDLRLYLDFGFIF